MNTSPAAQIVVIDDEIHICNIITEAFASFDYNIRAFSDPLMGIEYIKNNKVDLVLTDLVMGDYSGVDVIDVAQEVHKDAVVILMTAHPTVEAAIEVLKKGAYDFLVKPFKLDLLRATIERGLSHQKILRENMYLKEQVEFLKVTNASGAGEDKEEFMKLVINSCKKELSAEAVAIISLHPNSSRIDTLIHDCSHEKFVDTVSDKAIIEKMLKRKKHTPYIQTKSVHLKNKSYTQTFIALPICSRKNLLGVINVILISRFDTLTPGKLDVLKLLGNAASSTLTNYQLYRDLENSYLQAFGALANAIEARDAYTAGHTTRVCHLAELIAVELNWDSQKIRELKIGCTLHDIGKIGVPDSILNKQDKLTKDEQIKMSNHPKLGLKIIKGIEIFKPAIPYITSHHERFDGNGYPNGLKGEDIPIEGRLLAVADTFDAIMSDRPYRKGRNLQIAANELRKHSGTQFDPAIVDTFIKIMKDGKIDFVELYEREEPLSQLKKSRATEMVRA